MSANRPITLGLTASLSLRAQMAVNLLECPKIILIKPFAGHNMPSPEQETCHSVCSDPDLIKFGVTAMAYSNVGLGIAHSMAHTLGAVYDTPHGVACAPGNPKEASLADLEAMFRKLM